MTREENEGGLKLAQLSRINGIINSNRDFDQALRQVWEETTRLVDAQICAVLLLDDKGKLSVRSSHGIPPEEIKRFTLRLERGVGSWVVKKGEPAIINEVGRARKPALTGEDEKLIKSLLCYPLLRREKVLGLLVLINSAHTSAFSQEDLTLVSLMAVPLAMALESVRLYDLLLQDGMTKLYNHRFYLHRLQEEMARARRYGQPLSIMLLDIDRFSEVNRRYGEEAGDQVLAELTKVLEGSVRKTDILARYAGEEFGLILPNTSEAGASAIGRCLTSIVENSEFYYGAHRLKIRMSFGSHTLEDAVKDDKHFIRLAGEALQRHKREKEPEVNPMTAVVSPAPRGEA